MVHKNALPANLAVIAAALLLVFLLNPRIEQSWLIGWFSCIAATTGVRLILWNIYRTQRKTLSVKLWAHQYSSATLLVGLTWASSALFLTQTHDPYDTSIIYILLVAVMATSIPVLSVVPSAFYAYIGPPAIAMSSFYFLDESRFSFYLSLAALSYTALIIVMGRNMYKRVVESISLQFENYELIYKVNTELEARKNIQKLLEKHQQELEIEVTKRTRQLSAINRNLEIEIAERKRAEEDLKHMAHHDVLTNLPNRLLLDARLKHAIERARRTKNQVAVIFLDLDHFKHINDSLGHHVGDQLLQKVGAALQGCVREDDTVARLGGDEFIVILEQVKSTEDVHELAKKLLCVVTTQFSINEHQLFTSASIGISMFPDDGDTPDELIKNADAAMYKAKDKGRHNYHFYTKELTASAYNRVMLETNLRHAIENNELTVFYQPQVSLHNRKVYGVEALVRWEHPELGLLAPGKFLQVAEDSGLIVPLGEWVLLTACHQMVQWNKEGLDINVIAVNLAEAQIRDPKLVSKVEEILRVSDCSCEKLELEITENFIMKETEHSINTLNALRDMGISLAIDDFGTGYSSLSYLKKLPVNKLKIDQSFVSDITIDEDDAAIIRAIIALGNSMNLDIIAEGIETEPQEAFLKENACLYGQGFLYAHPMPAEEINKFVKRESLIF